MDAEVVGDDVRVQGSENKQRDGDDADEREHNKDEARDQDWREVAWSISRPARRCEERERSGGHLARDVSARFMQVYGGLLSAYKVSAQ
jgi:hypothetical protein